MLLASKMMDFLTNLFFWFQAANPLPSDLIEKLELKEPIRTAAVCVYPSRVKDAYEAIKLMNLTKEINIAAGNYNLHCFYFIYVALSIMMVFSCIPLNWKLA